MTTDNRASEPTPEQVEAAARAIWERYAGHGLWETLPAARKAPFLKDARAALVAAQGAAPQAFKPCAHVVCLCTPVLPSSGVDEDARRLSAWPTVDEVRAQFEKAADRIAFGRMIAEVERAAAEKAWDRCVGEMPIDQDWKIFYGDNNPYRGA